MMDMKNIDEIAKSWIGTKFKFQGRSKEEGCDCIGLILGIGEIIGFVSKTGASASEIGNNNYNFRSNRLLIKEVLDREFYPNGNIVLLNYGTHYHLGIITSEETIIHAHISKRAVISCAFDDFYKEKVIATYSYWKEQ